jgi:hypothetical protein
MSEDEKPAGLSFNRDLPLERGFVTRGDRMHGDGAVVEKINPAAVA